MDWSKTKTIFIVTFLILNLFLTWQLVETNHANKISPMTEATIQERLNQNNVTIEVELPEEEIEGLHVIGKRAPLSGRNVSSFTNQKAEIIDEQIIVSILNKPFVVDPKKMQVSLSSFLSMYVFKGSEYRFGRYEADSGRIFFYQTYDGKTAYTLDDEPLILQLNDEFQIVGYKQSYFEFEELEGRERQILSSLKALEVLLNEQLIKMNDTITNVEFGYYSFFSPQGDVQVFAPMWRVIVGNHTYLVNAIEGTVQQLA
ncbi:hypothetical protein GN156_07325 [bacterium LRH843]|nr:hypothetical protein [bacterium LRH843]